MAVQGLVNAELCNLYCWRGVVAEVDLSAVHSQQIAFHHVRGRSAVGRI